MFKKIAFGISVSVGALVVAWGVIGLNGPKDDRDIALSSLHLEQPEGCDGVVTTGWFGGKPGAISDALGTAADGSRLCIASGRYEVAIRVDAAVEIIGFGSTPPVIISSTPADVVQWHAKGGLLENLVLIQAGGVPSGSSVTGQNGSRVFRIGQPSYFDDEAHSGPTLVNSQVRMSHVAIENDIFSGVFASGPEAALDMSHSVISNSAEAGVLAINGAKVTLAQVEISKSNNEGIRLDTGAQLHAQEINISESGRSGVYSQNKAGFEISDSSIKTHGGPGITMGHRSGAVAVLDTEIVGMTAKASWGIGMRGGTDLRLERITLSQQRDGLMCLPVISGPDTKPLRVDIRDSRIIKNDGWGVLASGHCDVRVDDSTISGNRSGGIENGGVVAVSESRLIENGRADAGIYGGAGLLSKPASVLSMSDTEISGNRPNGLALSAGAHVDIATTRIHGNLEAGIVMPVLPKGNLTSYTRDMDRLRATHDLGAAAAEMRFQDVTMAAHPKGTWRLDTGYLEDGDYIEPVIHGLER